MRYLTVGWSIIALALVASGVARAANLDVSYSAIPSGSTVNLTQAGALDWVHWGLVTESSIDRKAGVLPQIADFTAVDSASGNTYVYRYGDNWNGYSWNDGTPTQVVTDTTSGVWAYSVPAMGSGFRFHVPASTNVQMLQVYVGAYAARGRFVAFLSDGSAAAFTNSANTSVNNLANGPCAAYSISFSAASTGQTLHVVYTVQTAYRPDGNVTLQAAALTAPGANSVPFVALTSPAEATTLSGPTNVTLTASAHDNDGAITLVEFYAGEIKLGESAGPDYSLTWTNPLPGRHILLARAVDNGAATAFSAPITLFIAGTGGSMAGSRATSPTAADLTTEGTSDWAHWGLSAQQLFNHKATGGSQISELTLIGTNSVTRYSNNRTAFSWSDGTPVATVSGTNVGIYMTGLENGFELSAPADSSARTLRVYAGLYGAHGNFQAWLTDFSAPAFTDTSVSNIYGTSYLIYTLDYSAASASQRLIVRYISQDLFDFDYGNVNLQAATLQAEAHVEPLQIREPRVVPEGDFVFSFSSELSRTYTIQFSPSLPATNWNVLTNVLGTGGTLSVTDAVNVGSQRFYRITTD